ncbi:multicopper oxidase domain-containing protein [Nitratireductor sp. CAU 1489]|uniref:Multicopper oxidase domain-containing protein n=1 Tax=Nitratireductor arenosus TaxID=2682096 RepID=A0A844QC20_9HYPH|nr:multicopper oxidase family protein [Nitratireductor arenosus]MVA96795.1 multicopper oxidase domain-containing protein [Nitratireductor arenosus]
MTPLHLPTLTRRTLLAGMAGIAAASILPAKRGLAGALPVRDFALRAAPGRFRLLPAPNGQTPVWSFNATVPGPEIRVRQGERLRISVENGLDEETTVHWHGVRTPNAMDGVPHLTQPPIAPGETFLYEFDAVDAGTFWYHPHQRSFEQVGRGLYGPLIVEEAEPLRVDREVTWVIDDWRLGDDAAITNDFGGRHDMMHGGRVGNTVTINGRVPDSFAVRKGERIRLRLINAANARIFALDFTDHEPVVVALDGQPVTPHRPADGRVVLGPAMRVDLVLDLAGPVGSRAAVVDRFYEGLEYRLIELAYGDQPLRDGPPDWPLDLPANPLAEPDVALATRHTVTFTGGMMGQMVMEDMARGMAGGGSGGGMMGGMRSMMGMMHGKGIWFVNGVAAEGPMLDPMLTLERGRSHVLAMTNATAWPHPIHLHGHSFRVISRDGEPTTHREWQDTVLMAPRETVEIALVADNPGDWMFHCHILEHQMSGMMGVIRVA